MPFGDSLTPETTPRIAGFDPQSDVPPELTWRPDIFGPESVTGAFMRQENTVGSVAKYLGDAWSVYYARASGWDTVDEVYDPFDDGEVLRTIDERPELAENFAFSRSNFESAIIRKRIDDEDEARETMSMASGGGVATMLALGFVDPVTFLPIGGSLYRTWRLGNVGRGALEGATIGLTASGVAEGVLQGTQETRTWQESAYNVGAATLLAGALGGALGLVAPSARKPLADAFAREVDEARAALNGPEGGGSSGGAASVRQSTLADETMTSGLGAELAGAHSVVVGNPISRLLTSPSLVVRQVARALTEVSFHFRGEAKGMAAPQAVETRVKMWDGPLSVVVRVVDDAFKEHRFGGRARFGVTRAVTADLTKQTPANRLTYGQFKARVAYAMRRGDEDPMFPEVTRAARIIREKLIDPLKDQAIKLELLPEDVHPTTAASYLTRLYNTEKIAAQRHSFQAIVREWLANAREVARTIDAEAMTKRTAAIEKAKATVERLRPLLGDDVTRPETIRQYQTIEKLKREYATAKRRLEKLTNAAEADDALALADDYDLADIARQVTDKILGHDGRDLYQGVTINIRGSLKHRSLTIPDRMIEDFLENDVERVLRAYKRQMGADVELARAFGRPDMAEQFEDVARHYERVRTGVTGETELAGLNARLTQDLNDLAAIRDRLRGTYAIPSDPNGLMVRTFRVVRGLNYMRLLGGATVSSLSDVARPIMVHGMGRFMRNGLRPLITSLKGVKLSAEEVKRAGTALDVVLDTRAAQIAEVGDEFGRHSAFERAIKYGQSKFGMLNLLSPWTAMWKQFSGIVSQTRILEEVERVAKGTATRKEREHLAYLGIDEVKALDMHRMAEKHAQVEPGLRVARTELWDDVESIETLRAALVKEIDATIVTTGIGERPLWMSTEWGKVIGQFKSFTLSSMSKVTAEGLQRRDAAALQGFVAMTALGMLTYYLKARPEDIDWDNPATWIKEGVDRSGVLGWAFEANNAAEKITGYGINTLTGSPAATRYKSRNIAGTVLGPSADATEDAVRLIRNMAQGEWTASDTHRIRKMLPAQNLYYLRWLFDRAERGINDVFDLPDKRKPAPAVEH